MALEVTRVEHPSLEQRYSARTNQQFLLHEAGVYAELLLAGATPKQIDHDVLEHNILQLRSMRSRETVLQALRERLDGAPPSLLSFLVDGSLDLRKLTNFYLILLRHRLLREFVAELVFEELRRLGNEIAAADINAYFERKREQVPQVSNWTDQTFQKARSNILLMCVAAGLLESSNGGYLIRPSVVPGVLRNELHAAGRDAILPLLLDGSLG